MFTLVFFSSPRQMFACRNTFFFFDSLGFAGLGSCDRFRFKWKSRMTLGRGKETELTCVPLITENLDTATLLNVFVRFFIKQDSFHFEQTWHGLFEWRLMLKDARRPQRFSVSSLVWTTPSADFFFNIYLNDPTKRYYTILLSYLKLFNYKCVSVKHIEGYENQKMNPVLTTSVCIPAAEVSR